MTIQITEAKKTVNGSYIQATCNNVSAMVTVKSYGIQVCCQNAAHKAWRGMGKSFPTTEAALANYKSGEMKAIIQAAVEFAA